MTSATSWCCGVVNLTGNNLFNHLADLDLNIARLRLADGDAVLVLFRNSYVIAYLHSTLTYVWLADGDTVLVRLFNHHGFAHFNVALTYFGLTDRHAVLVLFWNRHMLAHFDDSRVSL